MPPRTVRHWSAEMFEPEWHMAGTENWRPASPTARANLQPSASCASPPLGVKVPVQVAVQPSMVPPSSRTRSMVSRLVSVTAPALTTVSSRYHTEASSL